MSYFDSKGNNVSIFENSEIGKVRAVEKNGEPWFVAKDIAKILGYSKTEKVTKRLDRDEKALAPIWGTSNEIRQLAIVNESGLYNAIFGSTLPAAKTFKKWVTSEILPAIRKNGTYSIGVDETLPKKCTNTKALLDLELFVLDKLKCSESSKLEVVHKIHEDCNVPTKYLPVYTGNTKPTFSAKDLLKQNSLNVSPIAFNRLMLSKGLLEEKERTSKKGIKKFKALTPEGLKYGQNDTSKHNPREVQPHYFDDSFVDLFNLINQ